MIKDGSYAGLCLYVKDGKAMLRMHDDSVHEIIFAEDENDYVKIIQSKEEYSCEGCLYLDDKIDSFPCGLCSRIIKDRYEKRR